MKSKNVVCMIWAVVMTVLAVILGVALYGSRQQMNMLRAKLAEAQSIVIDEVAEKSQQAMSEELSQSDLVSQGKEKMQQLINQNKEALENGTLKMEEVSPLMAKQEKNLKVLLDWASEMQREEQQADSEPMVSQPTRPSQSGTVEAVKKEDKTDASGAKPSGTDNLETDNSEADEPEAGEPEADEPEADNSEPDNSTDSGNDSPTEEAPDNGGESGGVPDDSGSDVGADSGDGEDVGWTDEIL